MGRRLVPDEAQLQIILGSLLGSARLEGVAGERRMHVAHPLARERYAWWKYERLAPFAAEPPHVERAARFAGASPTEDETAMRIVFVTIAHPIFDDLAPFFLDGRRGRARVTRELLAPLGLAVWMSDAGRVELRADLFVPQRRPLGAAA